MLFLHIFSSVTALSLPNTGVDCRGQACMQSARAGGQAVEQSKENSALVGQAWVLLRVLFRRKVNN